ncbi:TPA: glycosyltransferase, partial [Streptococcus suis]
FNKNEWVKRGLEQNKVTTIYNGIANGNNTYKSQRKCNGEKIKIVITGALNESKSQDTLIKAIGKLPKKYCEKITLDILGSGDKDYTRYLHDLTKDCKLEGIINLVGYVKNAYSRFSEYDVGVITSKNEAFGRVTAEYMLNGLCVLGANSGATPELISDNYTGLLFEVDDSNNLAEKLQYILENEDLISNIGENARNQALREYTSDINAKNIYKLYMKILKEKV